MRNESTENRGFSPLWAIYTLVLVAWGLFCYGFFWRRPIASMSGLLLSNSPLLLVVLSGIAWITRDRWWPWMLRQLELHTESIDALPVRRIGVWIAIAAGLGLYSEMMIIRIHSSYFQLFAYFKNVSLLSCFLGLGIGYTLGQRRRLLTPLALPALAIQISMMHFLRATGRDALLQSPVSEELAFGVRAGEGHHLIAAYGFLILVFAFNALAFVPFGQLVSRLMSRIDKLTAYSWNLGGSLLGLLVFFWLSSMWAPPTIWLLVTSLGLMLFVRHRTTTLAATAVAGVLLIAVTSVNPSRNTLDVYSPYQQLTLRVTRGAAPELRVNHVYYQRVLPLDSASVAADPKLREWRGHYDLPYHFQPEPAEVLVVGAGTGNDVAAAVRAGAGHIDAVEIDPAILNFGRILHPEAPYDAPNVDETVADARNFIRYTPNRYDLIVYGLLDSHTLLSGKAGVRLDSYVYTVEAFREARSKLKEGGLISLTFSLIKPALGRKLFLMLEEAFDGERPVVHRTGYDEGTTFLIGEHMAAREFPPYPGLEDVTAEFAQSNEAVTLSTDDWPFFYMPVKKYPSSYVVMILVLLGVSLLFIRQLVPGSGSATSGPCFFLGAGFMLIETKGITELALVYGSTWIVIGIVIAGILTMAFLANLVVIRRGAPPPAVTYGLLSLSLFAGLYLTSGRLGTLSPAASGALLTGALTVPLFFSGFAFSTELKRAPSVAVALSSNLLGAMLGGFLEYNSMYFGFRSLYFLAFAMYAAAFVASMRANSQVARGGALAPLPLATDTPGIERTFAYERRP